MDSTAQIIVLVCIALSALTLKWLYRKGTKLDAETPDSTLKSKKISKVLMIVIAFIVLVKLFSGETKTTEPTSTPAVATSAAEMKANAMSKVKIKKLDWGKEGFDNVMIVNVTFENLSNRNVKDIVLTCNHYSNSQTKIDSNSRTIFEVIPIGKTKRVKNFNMGFIHNQASGTNCEISDLVLL